MRNFGHGCLTAQTGLAHDYALVARERWLELRDAAGLWVRESGTVVAARSDVELAVVSEFVEANPTTAELLTSEKLLARAPINPAGLRGGAFLPNDIRVDPRSAAPVLAAHLAGLGVEFHYGTAASSAETGVLHTSRGDVRADSVVLALGHDLDLLLPEPCEAAGLRRAQLHMLRVAAPAGFELEPALLSGTSLLRYDGFLRCPSSGLLRAELRRENPALLAAGVNLMMTQAANGDLIVGDTHDYSATPSPFADEDYDSLLLTETVRLLGTGRPVVRERWLGTYASTPTGAYLTPSPARGVVGVAVTSGIGMTTALGLAPAVLDQLS